MLMKGRVVSGAKEGRIERNAALDLNAYFGDALYIECRDRIFFHSFLPFFTVRPSPLARGTHSCVDRSRTVRVACHRARSSNNNTHPTMLHRCDDKPYLSVSSRSRQIRDDKSRSWNSCLRLASFAYLRKATALRFLPMYTWEPPYTL